MATDPNSLSNSARAKEANQDNSQGRVCIRKEFKQLILWHNWRKSLLIFVILQALLYDLTHKSLISVVSVSGQILLWISVGYRIYVWCLQCLNRTQIRGNPFQKYLDLDLSITPQQSQQLSQFIATKVCGFFNNFRSVAFLEKPLETIKWLAIMAGMSLVGHLFYVSTLLRWVLVLLFTMPKLYMWKQPIIDDRLKTLQKIYNCFCAGNPNKLNKNARNLENLDNLEIMEQCDKKIDQKDACLFPGSEIPEELCAGGDDTKTKKKEVKSVNEFEQFDSSWREENPAEYLLRKNL
ncbi:reticulon-1-A [Drosophila kikkawai]|uniref:Reticulon-like protein n=1 Tax=Drosophila kikkawai TaxID=30033 RepID=A0A6P4J768_DROKI|nr:reticulon-2 [Drosophila kikkawai]